MVNITEHNGLMAKCLVNLSGLTNNVAQNIRFNLSTDMQYALQFKESTWDVNLYRSTHVNSDFWDQSTTDDDEEVPTINLDRLMQIKKPLGGHTQTLLQDPFFIVTGLKHIVFTNLLSILNNATEQEKNDFFKNALDTRSWQEFNKAYGNSDSTTIDTNYWDMDFIALPNKLLSEVPVEGQYINIVGASSLVPGGYRSELTESPNRQHLLLAVIDHNKSVHLLVFDANLFDDLNMKYTDIMDSLSIYWNGSGFPIASEVGSNLRSSALSFYHGILDSDDLFYDLSDLHYVKRYDFTKSEILSNVGSSESEFSYQGFAIDNDCNIYISSGLAPKFENDQLIESPFYICKIKDNNFDSLDARSYLASLTKYDAPEIEGLQALDENHLLVVYAMHDAHSSSLTVTKNVVYEVKWAKV